MRLKWFQGVTLLLCITFLPNTHADSTIALSSNTPGYSSLVVSEIDGVTDNGKEIAVGSSDGTLTVLRSDGSVVWTKDLPNKTCSAAPNNDKLYSSPAVAALYGDNVPYIVIGYGGFNGKACDGGVIAFRGSDGEVAWKFSIAAFAKKNRFFAFRHAVYSTPAIADTNGDGKLEIGFGSFDRNVYLLNFDGSLRYYYNAADTVFSSPAFADVNGDGKKEMIIGTDISQNKVINPPTKNGGYVYALRTDPAPKGTGGKFPFRDKRLQVWRSEFDQVMQSSPAVGELIAGNPGAEIVVGSGCFFSKNGKKTGKWFKVLSAKTGKVLRTLDVPACAPGSPAIADLDGDNRNEVVVTVSGSQSFDGDGNSYAMAWQPDDNSVMWTTVPKSGGSFDTYGGHYSRSAIVADLDLNGSLEVVVPAGRGLAILNGETGAALSCENSSCGGVPAFLTSGLVMSTAAFGDINNDGIAELIVGSGDRSGAIKIWDTSLQKIQSQPGPFRPGTSYWSMSRGSAKREGKVENLD